MIKERFIIVKVIYYLIIKKIFKGMCNKYPNLEASAGDFLIGKLVSGVCVVQYLMIVGCCMRPASDRTAAADTADLLQTRRYCFRYWDILPDTSDHCQPWGLNTPQRLTLTSLSQVRIIIFYYWLDLILLWLQELQDNWTFWSTQENICRKRTLCSSWEKMV